MHILVTDNPLSTSVQYVKGVGPSLASKLAKMDILTIADLLYLIPRRYIDRRQILEIGKLTSGKDLTIQGKVIASGIAFLGRKRRRIFEVILDDGTGLVSGKWFYFKESYIKPRFPIGAECIFSGEVTKFKNGCQFIHPEVEDISIDHEPQFSERIVPVYPLTEGIYQKTMRKIVRNAWDTFGSNIEEVFPKFFRDKYNLEDPWTCLQELHFPSSDMDFNLLNNRDSLAHKTLIFSEFFFLELGLALRRKKTELESGISFIKNNKTEDFIKSLPFKLTRAQINAVMEINSDMERPHPMNRLLQGDVGSGKTIVALIAAVKAVENGYQASIMAPTEILAEQHFETFGKFLNKSNITFQLFTSGLKGKEREELREKLRIGDIDIAIGTHALIQDEVDFKNLGFVVIDEQHRFGVEQRAKLKKKGAQSDVLVMTATPIPRTLAMTLYGDLDFSVIDEMPPGRMPVMTRLYGEKQREKLYRGLKIELKKKHQAYLVYPLVAESEKLDLKDATRMAKELEKEFSPEFKVDLIHGKMKPHEKDEIMSRFKSRKIDILVATSVVEVGVDVPNATVMVIEHAERFGLSQLHQLRGRVGRSSIQSYCILMADYRRSEEAKHRLRAMIETNDGFKIAEEDLRLRGPGDFMGTKQSGLPSFKVGDLMLDVRILARARDVAFGLVDKDPDLSLPEHLSIAKELKTRWTGRDILI